MEYLNYGGDIWRDRVNDDGDVIYDPGRDFEKNQLNLIDECDILQYERDELLAKMPPEAIEIINNLHENLQAILAERNKYRASGYREKSRMMEARARNLIFSKVALAMVAAGGNYTQYYNDVKNTTLEVYDLKEVSEHDTGEYIDFKMRAAGDGRD